MRRKTDNRSDWADFSDKRKKAELAGAGDIYGYNRRCEACRVELKAVPDGGCDVKGCPYVPREEKARARPVQVEQQHAHRLATWAYRHWWYPGWTCIEHRSSHARETDARSQQGVKTGLPDSVLLIPARRIEDPIMCALELKAPHLAPKRDPGHEWWLEDFGDAASRHGLRREQAFWLRTMAGCGFRTKVAYGADQALAWLVEQAGPRPDVMPEGW